VHGDAVNLAARLEQLNKDYGSSVLVSETTVQLVEGSYPLDSIGTVPIRGKDSHVVVYSLGV
jgi:adenylate cyclase